MKDWIVTKHWLKRSRINGRPGKRWVNGYVEEYSAAV